MVTEVDPARSPSPARIRKLPTDYGGYDAKGPLIKASQAQDGKGFAYDAPRDPVDVEAEGHAAYLGAPELYKIGELIKYWSDTHHTWMDGKVKAQNFDPAGMPVSYDLDVKKGALTSKMRRHPSNTARSQTPAPQNYQREDNKYAAQWAAHPPLGSQEVSGDAPEVIFQVGDRVEYWSDIYSQWMQTTVQKVRDESQYYDLEVKKGAHYKKMRPYVPRASQPAPAPAPPPGPAPAPAAPQAPVAPLPGPYPAREAPVAPLPGPYPAREVKVLGDLPMPVPAAELAAAFNQQQQSFAPAAEEAAALGNQQQQSFAPAVLGRTPSVAPVVVRRATNTSVGLDHEAPPGAPAGQQVRSVSPITPTAASRVTQIRSGSAVGCLLQPGTGENGPGTVWRVANNGVTAGTPAGYTIGHSAKSASHANNGSVSLANNGSVSLANNGSLSYGGSMNLGNSGVAGVANAGSDLNWQESGVWEIHQQKADSARGAVVRGGSWAPSRGGTPVARPHHQPQLQHGMHLQQLSTAPMVSSSSSSVTPRPHELGQPLEAGELQIGSGPFNPSDANILAQLQSKLGFPRRAGVEELKGFRGGLNEGVWFIGCGACAPHEELVLKLVKCTSIAPTVPTEAENFQRVFREYPRIVSDPVVAFPRKIFRCKGSSGESRYDLICMRKMRGLRFAEVIAHKWHNNEKSELMAILGQVGTCIAEFHKRYGGMHHGDLQPSNVFYDEEAKQVTLIDVGGMEKCRVETDQEHFAKSLKLLSQHYGPSFATDGVRAFDSGYSAGASKP